MCCWHLLPAILPLQVVLMPSSHLNVGIWWLCWQVVPAFPWLQHGSMVRRALTPTPGGWLFSILRHLEDWVLYILLLLEYSIDLWQLILKTGKTACYHMLSLCLLFSELLRWFQLGISRLTTSRYQKHLKEDRPFPFQRLNSQNRDGVKSLLLFALEEALSSKAIIGSREGTLLLIHCLQRCSLTFFSAALQMVAIVSVVYFRSSSSGAGGTIAALKMLPNNTDWLDRHSLLWWTQHASARKVSWLVDGMAWKFP